MPGSIPGATTSADGEKVSRQPHKLEIRLVGAAPRSHVLEQQKGNPMEHVKEILAGLAVFIVVLAIVAGIFLVPTKIAHENNQKQQHMNEICIAKGYIGWSDQRTVRDGPDLPAGCVKEKSDN